MKLLAVFFIFMTSFSQAATMEDSVGAYIKVENRLTTISSSVCDKIDSNFSEKIPAPVGTIARKAEKIPGFQNLRACGYIPGRGQSVKKEEYPDLYLAIGCNWGCRNPKSFTLPQFSTHFFKGY